MEQWEKEYIDAVVKSKQAMGQGKTIHHSYEEGYDSSRWVEMTLPDGKKHYIPKESVGNRSCIRKYGSSYQAYNDSCFVDSGSGWHSAICWLVRHVPC